MDYNQIRNKLALMHRGQEVRLDTVEDFIEVRFDTKGTFKISVNSRTGNSGSVYATESLKEAVLYIQENHYVPKVGHKYQHINGNVYTVIAIANMRSERPEYPPTVVYQGSNELVWCKPLVNFIAKMTRVK